MVTLVTTALLILLAAILAAYGTFLPETLRGRLDLPKPAHWVAVNAYLPPIAYAVGLHTARTPIAVGQTALMLMVGILPGIGACIGVMLWRNTMRDVRMKTAAFLSEKTGGNAVTP